MRSFSSFKRRESLSAYNLSILVNTSAKCMVIINMSKLFKDCFVLLKIFLNITEKNISDVSLLLTL